MPQTIDNMLATWSNSLTTYSGIKMNVQGPGGGAEQSSASSLLMDLQVGGSSKVRFDKIGSLRFTSDGSSLGINGTNSTLDIIGSGVGSTSVLLRITNGIPSLRSDASFGWAATTTVGVNDTILTRRAAANLRLGAADAAAPVAQTLSVQSVVAGTTNTAGANLTITGSQGTGTGAGGSIVFQVAPAGSNGTAQNALATALTIDSTQLSTFGGQIRVSNTGTSASKCGIQIGGAGFGLFSDGTVMTAAVNGSALMQWWNGGQIDLLSSASLGWGSSGVSNPDVRLARDAANTLALRNGANAQTFRVYNTTDGTNSEFGKIAWSSNVLQIGTEKAGTGTARALEFQTDGTTRLTIAANGTITNSGAFSNPVVTGELQWTGRGSFTFTGDGLATMRGWGASFGLLRFGGTDNTFPALKRSSTTLQARLADDSAFASVQGKLTTDTAYTAGDPTTTGYLVVYDSGGVAYKIPAVAL